MKWLKSESNFIYYILNYIFPDVWKQSKYEEMPSNKYLEYLTKVHY